MEVVGTDRLFVIAGASPRFQSKSVCSSSCAPYADVFVSLDRIRLRRNLGGEYLGLAIITKPCR